MPLSVVNYLQKSSHRSLRPRVENKWPQCATAKALQQTVRSAADADDSEDPTSADLLMDDETVNPTDVNSRSHGMEANSNSSFESLMRDQKQTPQ